MSIRGRDKFFQTYVEVLARAVVDGGRYLLLSVISAAAGAARGAAGIAARASAAAAASSSATMSPVSGSDAG